MTKMLTKVGQVYQSLLNLTEDGHSAYQTTQPELARLTGVSVSTLYRITSDLQAMGLIRATPDYKKGKRSGIVYDILPLSVTGRPIDDSSIGHGMTDSNLNDLSIGHGMTDSNLINRVTCHPMTDSAAINHDDDDRENISSTNLIMAALDFLDLNGRLKLARLPHVTPGLAEQARRYVEHLKMTKQWKPGSPGRVYRLIEADAVPTQFEMPAAIAELPEIEQPIIFVSRGMTQAEIVARHPAAQTGLTLGADGMWR